MAIRSKEELMQSIKAYIKEDVSDEALALLEDFNDTYESLSASSGEDWKAKYEENDAAWRSKYAERFSGGGGNIIKPDPPVESDTVIKPDENETDAAEEITYDDLFE